MKEDGNSWNPLEVQGKLVHTTETLQGQKYEYMKVSNKFTINDNFKYIKNRKYFYIIINC